jgi:hypothetical protein
MKKVAVLTLLATLNLGGAAGELIFQDGFESGWPNAWAEAAGWSAFVVKDSTGELVGPVVGWFTVGDEEVAPVGIPLVAVLIGGEKVIFKVVKDRLMLSRTLLYSGADCAGQVYMCTTYRNCGGSSSSDVSGFRHAELRGVSYAIDDANVLHRAVPPTITREEINSFTEETYEGVSCVNRSPTTLMEGWIAEPVVDLDTLFIPPFSVE